MPACELQCQLLSEMLLLRQLLPFFFFLFAASTDLQIVCVTAHITQPYLVVCCMSIQEPARGTLAFIVLQKF